MLFTTVSTRVIVLFKTRKRTLQVKPALPFECFYNASLSMMCHTSVYESQSVAKPYVYVNQINPTVPHSSNDTNTCEHAQVHTQIKHTPSHHLLTRKG